MSPLPLSPRKKKSSNHGWNSSWWCVWQACNGVVQHWQWNQLCFLCFLGSLVTGRNSSTTKSFRVGWRSSWNQSEFLSWLCHHWDVKLRIFHHVQLGDGKRWYFFFLCVCVCLVKVFHIYQILSVLSTLWWINISNGTWIIYWRCIPVFNFGNFNCYVSLWEGPCLYLKHHNIYNFVKTLAFKKHHHPRTQANCWRRVAVEKVRLNFIKWSQKAKQRWWW